ncbi:hypothetical protein ACF3NA_08160 [Alkanindiges sp. WGS2144]|uniref:hypothetical protein n=1 Tax=Alkanindiges sp. WGS2144 TaxID=3366808 RepID=UPI003752F69D
MTRQKPALHEQAVFRLLTAVIGLILLGAGIFAVWFVQTPAMVRIPLGLLLMLLGGDAVWSAYRARPAWVSKIGSLP